MNKSGVSAVSGVQLTQSNFNSNARYYQDQSDSVQGDKVNNRNTIGSQNNLMSNTMVSSGSANLTSGNSRPITRDIK